MSNLEAMSNTKNTINGLRILFGLSAVLMFISICQGHNTIGLLFLGAGVVFLCLLTHKHDDRVYYEQLYTGEE